MHPTFTRPIRTPEGVFTARFSARGLVALTFPGTPGPRAGRVAPPAAVRRWQRQTARALAAVLAGRPPGTLPPLDPARGTTFQRRVWEELRRLRPGQTRTYGDLAARVGRPGAARAVGQACGANPVPVLIPCHRVLAAGGRLGGFSGGTGWKARLLAREGVRTRWRGGLRGR
jgi:O-6-methylguanine DNA methyltransferase